MDFPPQPPPDVPAPPPGPEAIDSQIKWRMICIVGGVSVAFAGILFLHAKLDGRNRGSDRSEALSNIRQVGLCLFAFDEEYGRFPDPTTIPAVQVATGTTLALGNSSSNGLFRQLLATVIKSEKIFWTRTSTTPKRPNDLLGADALAPGECAFSYVAGLTSAGDPETPILMTPMIRGTWKFDPEPFGGKAIVYCLDCSATALPIDKNGDVILNGMNLFDPRQPFWRGKAPDIKYPE